VPRTGAMTGAKLIGGDSSSGKSGDWSDIKWLRAAGYSHITLFKLRVEVQRIVEEKLANHDASSHIVSCGLKSSALWRKSSQITMQARTLSTKQQTRRCYKAMTIAWWRKSQRNGSKLRATRVLWVADRVRVRNAN